MSSCASTPAVTAVATDIGLPSAGYWHPPAWPRKVHGHLSQLPGPSVFAYVLLPHGSYVHHVSAVPSVRLATCPPHSPPQAKQARARALRSTSCRFTPSRFHGTPHAAPPNPACSGLRFARR